MSLTDFVGVLCVFWVLLVFKVAYYELCLIVA